jgi:hypothetical protein
LTPDSKAAALFKKRDKDRVMQILYILLADIRPLGFDRALEAAEDQSGEATHKLLAHGLVLCAVNSLNNICKRSILEFRKFTDEFHGAFYDGNGHPQFMIGIAGEILLSLDELGKALHGSIQCLDKNADFIILKIFRKQGRQAFRIQDFDMGCQPLKLYEPRKGA